jgi:hypothetical protein
MSDLDATAELRFVEKTIEVRFPDCYRDNEFKYLEQKWVCSGTGKVEWRQVPTIHVTEIIDENGTVIKHGKNGTFIKKGNKHERDTSTN